jgi:integrase/recombinase XerC
MIKMFNNYLEINNYSKKYVQYVQYFLLWCEQNKVDVVKVTYTDMSNYIVYLQSKKFANSYINLNIHSIRAFYRCLIVNNVVSDELLKEICKVKSVRLDKKIRQFVNQDEFEKLVGNAMSFYSHFQPNKSKAILYFLYYTGLRKGELLNIKREDINLDECSAIVRTPTKNKMERTVFFVKDLVPHLQEYFNSEPEEGNAFCLSVMKLYHFFACIKSFLPKEKKKGFNVHSMRHSFARMLASNDVDMRIAQKLLGHKSLNSTLIYYDPDLETVRKIYKSKVK